MRQRYAPIGKASIKASRRCNRVLRLVAILVFLSTQETRAADGLQQMIFRDSCKDGERVVIAAVGDILLHNSIQRQAISRNGSYSELWASLRPVLEGADVTFGNLEGSIAPGVSLRGRETRDPGRRYDGYVYGGPRGSLNYNYHPSLATDLRASGFDLVSTANNHGDDRGKLGIDRTIASLRAAGLPFVGTRESAEDQSTPWHIVTRAGSMNIAWLACTYGTNGVAAHSKQMLQCYRDEPQIMESISTLSAAQEIDAVILTPHWGVEKSPTPTARDRKYSIAAIEAGASVVIGSHPHVLQRWEKITASDNREGLVIYSTGNFVSNQVSDDQRTGIIALIELVKPSDNVAKVSAVGFIPTWVTRGPYRVDEIRMEAGSKVRRANRSLL